RRGGSRRGQRYGSPQAPPMLPATAGEVTGDTGRGREGSREIAGTLGRSRSILGERAARAGEPVAGARLPVHKDTPWRSSSMRDSSGTKRRQRRTSASTA